MSRIHAMSSDAAARDRLGVEQARGVQHLPVLVGRPVHELTERLPASTRVYLARDAQGRYILHLDDRDKCYPFGRDVTIEEDGSLLVAGAGHRCLTVEEFVAASPVTRDRVAVTAALALEAFWAEVRRQLPSIKTGDMPPGELDALGRVARATVRQWVRNNDHILSREDGEASARAADLSAGS